MSSTLIHVGECVETMRLLPADSIDSIVCDPPYGLEFMGKAFDTLGDGNAQQAWHAAWCAEALRVLKPGGYLLAFGGTRTYHRLACAVEDAGFEIRDSLIWNYGVGFPKSLDVSKAIDKAAGAEREVIGPSARHVSGKAGQRTEGLNGSSTFAESVGMGSMLSAPATEAAKRWQGWGTALKPAFEPVVVARKPLIGTVAANVLVHGTGALNIDACRVEGGGPSLHGGARCAANVYAGQWQTGVEDYTQDAKGRWPANVIFTHAPGCGDECAPGCPVAALDAQSGVLVSKYGKQGKDGAKGLFGVEVNGARTDCFIGDTGGASRFFTVTEYGDDDDLPGVPFFYNAKASRSEREAGCGELPGKTAVEAVGRDPESAGAKNPRAGAGRGAGAGREWCLACDLSLAGGRRVSACPESEDGKHVPETRETGVVIRNIHPTVKPVAVMRWLCRLVTPPGGIVLDPFAGSGTTGVACVHEEFLFIGIEREAEYADIARARIAHATNNRRAS